MNRIEIQPQTEMPFPVEELEKILEAVLEKLDIDNWEVSVVIADADAIRRLNREYRLKDAPTDILSFPQDGERQPDGFVYAGDLVFCPEEITANCKQFSEAEKTEWLRLAVHGILHLSGQTHDGYGADEPMLKYQETIVEELKNRV